MEQGDAQAGEGAGGEPFVHVHGGLEALFSVGSGILLILGEQLRGLGLFSPGLGSVRFGGERGLGFVAGEVELGLVVAGALDDGVDDIGLAAEGHLLADEVPDLVSALVGHAACGNRRASGG